MAASRDKRATAGAKMAHLLDNEDEDDFYKTTYGGFMEEQDDNDYRSEVSDSDTVDSDFSIDEDDDVHSDVEDDEWSKKRQKGVVTKAYKEPKLSKKDEKPRKPKQQLEPKLERPSIQIYQSSIDKKSLRRSTAEKSRATFLREKEREARSRMLKEIAARKNVSEVRRLTQEELLEEAKRTEELNMKSLETYQRLESEKKKSRIPKQVYKGPVIRYQSVTMPLIEELPPEPEINVDGDAVEQSTKEDCKPTGRCSRTFITFTDEKTFKEYFPKHKPKPVTNQLCPVTRLPAKYIDPLTLTPYANIQAFKVIREAFYHQQEMQNEQKKKNNRAQTPVQQHQQHPLVATLN